jgi:histidine triad (HIT) family protein
MEGYNLWVANGEAAGQEVFHVHLHVLPRFKGDGFGLRFPANYGRRPEREALDALAERVRAALEV